MHTYVVFIDYHLEGNGDTLYAGPDRERALKVAKEADPSWAIRSYAVIEVWEDGVVFALMDRISEWEQLSVPPTYSRGETSRD